MGFLNSEGLEYLVNKLSDSSNIKIAGNPNGTRVGAVVDKLVEKTDTVTGAVDMEIENEVGSFKVGTGLGSTDVSATVEDGFSEIEIKGNTVQNLVLEDNVEVVPSGAMVSAEATSLKLDTASGNVDMSIKGRTLQNLSPRKSLPTRYSYLVSMIKPSTTYTVIYNYENQNESGGRLRVQFETTGQPTVYFGERVYTLGMGLSMYSFVSPSTFERSIILAQSYEVDGTFNTDNIMILEGDYTNKPLPQYFEGLKSVGEIEGNKIEVSSNNINYLDKKKITKEILSPWRPVTNINYQEEIIKLDNGSNSDRLCAVRIKTPTVYINNTQEVYISFKARVSSSNCLLNYTYLMSSVGGNNTYLEGVGDYRATTEWKNIVMLSRHSSSMIQNQHVYIMIGTIELPLNSTLEIKDIIVSYTNPPTNEYIPYKIDKKQISLSQPLRGLPNGTKDSIELVNGEWKIIRRCGEIVFNGGENWLLNNTIPLETSLGLYTPVATLVGATGVNKFNLISDRFPTTQAGTGNAVNPRAICWSTNATNFLIDIEKASLSTQDINGFKQWLQANPTKVIYELATPIIEDMDAVTLQCWKNGTLSIGSVIPVESTHTVSLNKPSQIKKNIEELTALRHRVKTLEEQYDQIALEQAHKLELLNHSFELDYNI